MVKDNIIELNSCENSILQEIFNKTMKQKDVAQTYALCMRSSESVDWSKVNDSIIKRWSVSGLNKIKDMAWSGKCWD